MGGVSSGQTATRSTARNRSKASRPSRAPASDRSPPTRLTAPTVSVPAKFNPVAGNRTPPTVLVQVQPAVGTDKSPQATATATVASGAVLGFSSVATPQAIAPMSPKRVMGAALVQSAPPSLVGSGPLAPLEAAAQWVTLAGARRQDGEVPATSTASAVAANSAPVIAGVTLSKPNATNGAVTGTVKATDPNGDALSYQAVTSTKGKVTINRTGVFTYTPTATSRHEAAKTGVAASGKTDTVTITVTDSKGAATTSTVTVAISAKNTVPTTVTTVNTANAATGVVTGSVKGTDADKDTVTYTAPTSTTKGTISIDARTGAFAYTPTATARHNASTTGATSADKSDTVTVTVSDGYGASVAVPVMVTIAPANTKPTATATVGKPDAASGVVAGSVNAADPDKDTLTYTASKPANGSVAIKADGTFTYTPTSAARAGARSSAVVRTDSFTVTVSDAHGGTTAVTVTPTIAASNSAPVAGAPTYATNSSSGVVSGKVTATDPDKDTVTYAAPASTSKGSVSINATTGAFTYTPSATARHMAAKTGATPTDKTDTFNVTVSDRFGASTVVTVNVSIVAANAAPVISAPKIGTPSPTTGVISGTVSATDLDKDTLAFSGSTTTSKGTVTVAADGSFTYTPNASARHAAAKNGAAETSKTDTFTVTVSDGYGAIAKTTVAVTVASANSAPTVVTTIGTPDQLTAVSSGTVTATDTDRDTLSYAAGAPSRGTAVVNSDGHFTYTPNTAFRDAVRLSGQAASDSFTITVTDGYGGSTRVTVTATVDASNAAPVITAMATEQPNAGTGTVVGSVTVTDADRDSLTYRGSGSTGSGTVVVNSDGTFTYTPTWAARHDAAVTNTRIGTISGFGSPSGVALNQDGTRAYVVDQYAGTVAVIDTANNTVLSRIGGVGNGAFGVAASPDGRTLYVSTISDGSVAVVDLRNETVASTLSGFNYPYGLAVSPDGSRLYVTNTGPNWQYSPPGTGSISVINTSTNAVVSTISGLDSAPIGIATSLNGDRLYVSDLLSGQVQVINSSNGAMAPPISGLLQPTGVAVSPDGSKLYVSDYVGGGVSVIDTTTHVTSSTISGLTAPIGVAIGRDGRVYIAEAGQYGAGDIAVIQTARVRTDSFVISVDDGHGGTAQAPITVIVGATNNAPAGNVTLSSPDPNTGSLTGTVTGVDPDGDTLTFSGTSYTPNGVVSVNADGSFSYWSTTQARHDAASPSASPSDLTDGFTVYIEDGHGGRTPISVTTTVLPSNQAPVAYPQVPNPDPYTGVVLGTVGGSDNDGDTLAYSVTSTTSKGALTLDSQTGSFTYTATDSARQNARGGSGADLIDSFNVTITDAYGGVTPITVNVPVAPTNIVPVVGAVVVGQPDAQTGVVLGSASATDGDGDPLTYSGSGWAGGGMVAVNANGTFSYSPYNWRRHYAASTNASPADLAETFNIYVDDGFGGLVAIPVTATIAPYNRVPNGYGLNGTPDQSTGAVSGQVVRYDDDWDAVTLSLTSATSKGALAFDPSSGVFTFTPTDSARWNARYGSDPANDRVDTFGVSLSDGHGGVTPVTITVPVGAVNVVPIAGAVIVGQPDPQTGVVLGSVSATDADGDPLTYSGSGWVGSGVLAVNADGTFSYSPSDGRRHLAARPNAGPADLAETFNVYAEDGFGGVVAIPVTATIAPYNQAPNSSLSIGTPDQSTGVVPGQLNGYDPDWDSVTYELTSTTSKGVLTFDSSTGGFLFAPTDDARQNARYGSDPANDRIDTFSVSLSDGCGGVTPVTVTVPVGAVNVVPVAGAVVVGQPDVQTGVVLGSVSATDGDGDPLTYSGSGWVGSGVLVVNADGTFSYSPSNGRRHYAARPNATPADLAEMFNVYADDGFGGVVAIPVTATIAPYNQAPTSYVLLGTPNQSTGAVLGQVVGYDPDWDTVTFSLTSTTSKGALTFDASIGVFTYTPTQQARAISHIGGNPAVDTIDTFSVTISDGYGGVTPVTVTVPVSVLNTAPVAGTVAVGQPDSGTGVVLGSVSATDTDGDSLTYSGSTTTSKGTVVVNANGSFTYTPRYAARVDAAVNPTPETTLDSFSVTVVDGYGGSTVVPISVPIGPAARPSVTVGIDQAWDPNFPTNVVEGNSGTTVVSVPVVLSRASDVQVTVNYSLSNWSATAGVDYLGGSGQVLFAPGETRALIPVTIIGDTTYENSEYIEVNLTGATNAIVVLSNAEPGLSNYGYITIRNDDVA